jgi:phosphopantothenoylcysteine decarboxylase/phosphopantothenate--cysteine ligase
MNMKNKTILVCVCGGIAAYKVCEVVSKLVQAGAEVRVAMTAEAQRFVGVATFQALTANPVYTDLWTPQESRDPQHVRLAQKEDLLLVAPCTANMMAKMAAGIGDELVSTLLLAADPRRVVIAPAMNEGMWNHPATQRNAQRLREDGVAFIGPAAGWQACRTVGMGRMSEAAEIIEWIVKKLGGKEKMGNRN